MTTATREILVPHFSYGTYPSADGTPVKFTDELMRKLERNTNFVIGAKILTPPVTYDAIDENGKYLHNSAKSTDAHGAVTRAVFRDGVLHLGIDPSATLRSDVHDRKRLRVSGVVHPNYWYNDEHGKRIEIGPTVIATTMLGNQRPAMRNPKIVPLSELPFSEDTDPVDAWTAREELRKSGFIAQTLADGSYAFSEIDIDPKAFGEPQQQESTMTDAEIQAAIATGVKATIGTAVADAVAAAVKPLDEKIKNFSEEGKRVQKVDGLVEKLKKEKPLGQIALDAYRVALLEPSEANVQAFAEKLPAFIAPGGVAGRAKTKEGGAPDDEDDHGDEPKALAAVRPKHFAEIDEPRNQVLIDNALLAFAEFKPDALKGIEQNPAAQMERLRSYVTARDTGSPAN